MNNILQLKDLTRGYYIDNSVYSYIESFLSMHETNSRATSINYENRIKEFCLLVYNISNLKSLKVEALTQLTKHDIQVKYIDKLKKKNNGNNTIEVKLSSLKSFFNFLSDNKINVNSNIFSFKLKTAVQQTEYLSKNEIKKLFTYLKEISYEQYIVAKVLYYTCNRKNATFNLLWKDLKNEGVIDGERVWSISVVDKGNKIIKKSISDSLAKEILELKSDNKKDSDKIFNISYKTFERSIKNFNCRISIHSFKVSGITHFYQSTKDMEMCKILGSHESIETTHKYIRNIVKLNEEPSYLMSKNETGKSINLEQCNIIEFLEKPENRDLLQEIENRYSLQL